MARKWRRVQRGDGQETTSLPAGARSIFHIAGWLVWLVGAMLTTSVVFPLVQLRLQAQGGDWWVLAGLVLAACAGVQFALSIGQGLVLGTIVRRRTVGLFLAGLALFLVDDGLNVLGMLMPTDTSTLNPSSVAAYLGSIFATVATTTTDGIMVAAVIGMAVGVLPELLWHLARVK